MSDLISREDAIKAVAIAVLDDRDELEAIKALPSADAVSREDYLQMTINYTKMTESFLDLKKYVDMLEHLSIEDRVRVMYDAVEDVHNIRIINEPSAEAEPKMTEEVREALMRLTMCAREECDMCKYKDECGFEFQYKISTENMHTILDALSAEAVSDDLIIKGAKGIKDGWYKIEDGNLYDYKDKGGTVRSYQIIPSAEAVQGEWQDKEVFNETDDDHIVDEWQSARCSVCGKYHTTPFMYYFDNFNFCPNCGAKMHKGGEDE